MTLDVHHPSPADVDPFGEGVSARSCRQRANESDKSQQFHDDVFHGCSLFRLQLTCSMSGNFHKSHPVIFYCARRAKTLMQINCESRRSQSSVAVPVCALVIRGNSAQETRRPLYPRKRTFVIAN